MLNRSACHAMSTAFSQPCLVNLISKDTHLVFSIYHFIDVCRYIYYNYREWDKEEGESDNETEADDPMRDVSDRSFCENIKVGVIDLQTMTRLTDITYEGHIGFSSYPAWYICLAASQDYLGRYLTLFILMD